MTSHDEIRGLLRGRLDGGLGLLAGALNPPSEQPWSLPPEGNQRTGTWAPQDQHRRDSGRTWSYGGGVWPKDEQRIREELAGVARPAPATLAPSHLAQSLEALDDACSPESVLTPRRIWPLKQTDTPSARRTLSEITQRNYCLTATLFAAFAAEAYVNDFLQAHDLRSKVTSAKYQKLDRGGTYRKYVTGVALAYEPVFNDGDEAMPAIRELFEVRDKMVHPRSGTGPPVAYMRDPNWRSEYPPTKVAEWIVAVGGAAELMEMRCYGFDYNSVPAALIWHGRQIMLDLAAKSEPLPDPTDHSRPALIELLADDQAARAQHVAGLKLTVNEVRNARLKKAAEVGPWDTFTELISRSTMANPPAP